MERKENRLPVFTQRFRELQGTRSNTEFADFLRLSRQTVGFYCNGDRLPDVITLKQIAKKCDVTTDWLLGLTDVSTQDNDRRLICEYTGLNENSIDFLHDFIADKDENGVYPAGFTDKMYNPKCLLNNIFLDALGSLFPSMVDLCDGINELYEENESAQLIVTEIAVKADSTRERTVQRLSHNELAKLKIEYAKSTFSKYIDFIVGAHEKAITELKKGNDQESFCENQTDCEQNFREGAIK